MSSDRPGRPSTPRVPPAPGRPPSCGRTPRRARQEDGGPRSQQRDREQQRRPRAGRAPGGRRWHRRRSPAATGVRARPPGRGRARVPADAVTWDDDVRASGRVQRTLATPVIGPALGHTAAQRPPRGRGHEGAPTIGDGQVADDRDPGRPARHAEPASGRERRDRRPAATRSSGPAPARPTTPAAGSSPATEAAELERDRGTAWFGRRLEPVGGGRVDPDEALAVPQQPGDVELLPAPFTSVAPTRRSASDRDADAASVAGRVAATGAIARGARRGGLVEAGHGRPERRAPLPGLAATPDSRPSALRQSSPVPARRSPGPMTRRRGGRRSACSVRRGPPAAARCRRRSRTRRSRSRRGGRWHDRSANDHDLASASPASPVRSARGAGSAAVPILGAAGSRAAIPCRSSWTACRRPRSARRDERARLLAEAQEDRAGRVLDHRALGLDVPDARVTTPRTVRRSLAPRPGRRRLSSALGPAIRTGGAGGAGEVARRRASARAMPRR